MKSAYARRYRSRTSALGDKAQDRKGNQQEPFFAGPSASSFFSPRAVVQRKCAHCEAEEKVSRMSAPEEEKKVAAKEEEKKELHRQVGDKEEDKKLQRVAEQEEEKSVSRMPGAEPEEKKLQKTEEKKKEEVQRVSAPNEELDRKEAGGAGQTAPSVGAYIHALDGKGTSLPKEARQFFGQRMGHDFSGVRIHTGSEAEQSAKAVNAKAYTVEEHIVFGKGQYNPSSGEGKKLLAHELAHVIQNGGEAGLARKIENKEKDREEHSAFSGHGHKATGKTAKGACEDLQVEGRTDFNPLPSSFSAQNATKPSDACEECSAPDCITARGTIVSRFRSSITVTLPPVPHGLTPCEAAAVRRFINTTLRQHEQQHVTAFSTYNGVVRTPYTYSGCRSGLQEYLQSIHDGIDAQRSADAIARSNALDPFHVAIPCDCP